MLKQISNFALIIGAMKCGTTSLFDYLSQHPQISPCKIKEPNFFADDINWNRGFSWYQELWDWNPNIHKVALEASTHYTKIPKFTNAAFRISQIKANFKFIYILRHPLERIESHYTHGVTAGWETTKRVSEQRIDRQLIEVSKYAKQIKEYYQRFPAEDILLVNFEDFKENPHEVVRSVVGFLGLNNEYEFKNLKSVSNANNQRVVYPSWTQKINFISNNIPEYIKKLGRSLLSNKVENNIALTQEEKQIILKELQSDLHELQEKYHFDLSSWNIKY